MNLKQIEAFVKVANNKSFSRTAKELYLTQPTISAHISSLESELNIRLFVRTTKGVHLTRDGKKLYLYARQMIELENTILTLFREGEPDTSRQRVMIAASTIPAQYLLPGILARYSQKHPYAQFSVKETDSAGVIREITEHTAEIGFTGTKLSGQGCTFYPFYEDELVIITPATDGYRALLEQNPGVAWIADAPVILREEGSGTRKEAEKNLRDSGINPDMLNIVATISSPEAIIRSVKSGIGVTVISRLAAKSHIENGEVLCRTFPDKIPHRKMYMVVGNSYQPSEAAKLLMNIVRNGIRKNTD